MEALYVGDPVQGAGGRGQGAASKELICVTHVEVLYVVDPVQGAGGRGQQAKS